MGIVPTETGSLSSLKKRLKKASGGGSGIAFIPKNGSRTVRFMDEPEDFIGYQEHWDDTIRKSYPCIGEANDCPGCLADKRRTSRNVVNALDVDKKQVIALQLPTTVVNKLVNRFDRYQTICDRDYEISKSGEGLDTDYDIESDTPRKRDMKRYKKLDIPALLEKSYNDAMGEDEDEDESPRRKKKRGGPRRKIARRDDFDEDEDIEEDEIEDDEDEDEEPFFSDDDEEDEEDEPPRRTRRVKKTRRSATKRTVKKRSRR